MELHVFHMVYYIYIHVLTTISTTGSFKTYIMISIEQNGIQIQVVYITM